MGTLGKWLGTRQEPGLEPRYWAIAWGDHVRGPHGKSGVDVACKNAYGMVSAQMLAVDCGTRIAPIRTSRFHKIVRHAVKLQGQGHAGIFRADWTSLTVVKVASWIDEPYVSVFKTRLDLEQAKRDPQQVMFEDRMGLLASRDDAEEAVRELWRSMFETDPKEDERFLRFVREAGYEWPGAA